MKRPTEAFRSETLFELGVGYVVVSRYKADGRVEAGFFLLDVFCLGAKDAGFERFENHADFEASLLDALFRAQDRVPMSPGAARWLVEEAVRYADGLGLAPCPDYKAACRVFGGIVPDPNAGESFAFGKDGKPFYIPGPRDTAERRARVLERLEARCGKDGFQYLGPGGTTSPEDEDDDNLSGLEEMASRMKAEAPDLDVRVNPEGCSKLSEMLLEVAGPLLDDNPDIEVHRGVLKAAALAWNYRLSDEQAQREMLDQVAVMRGGQEIMEMFVFLVARADKLFPGENRFILKVEVEPDHRGDASVRVLSTMPGDREPSHP